MIISGQKAEAWRCFLLQCHSSFQAKIYAHDEHSLSIIIVIASNKEVHCSFRTSPHLDNACVSKHNRAAKEYKVSKKMSRVITKVRFFLCRAIRGQWISMGPQKKEESLRGMLFKRWWCLRSLQRQFVIRAPGPRRQTHSSQVSDLSSFCNDKVFR